MSADVDVLGAAGRGEGHIDGNILLGLLRCVGGHGREIYGVDQAEVDNVDGDLGIVTALQCAEDVLFGDWGRGSAYKCTVGWPRVQIASGNLQTP